MSGPSPSFRSAVALRDDALAGKLSVRDIVEETLRRIDRTEPVIDAFLHVDAEGARARADELDKRVAAGEAKGRLFGVPIAVKDNICTRGQPTTCGSRILEGYLPPYDAHVVDRLLAEGAVLIGKTNLDEFGMGSSTENSAFKPTRNPHDPTRVPGGSSGGSAAAVAAGVVPLALGTDTGGSIRQPAALCGVVGFKPTYGTVSRRGLVAFASSLDQIGPLGASVLDVAHLASILAGHDPKDATSAVFDPPDLAASLTRSVDGLRLGVHEDYLEKIRDAAVKERLRDAVAKLRDAGARIVRLDDIDFLTKAGIPTYYVVATAEASANLARFDGMRYGPREEAKDLATTYARTRGRRFGAEVQRRVLLGTFALRAGHKDAYYERACRVRRRIEEAFARAFEKVDLMIGGTSPVPAFPLGERVADPVTMYRCDALTVPASLAGLPAASVPCGRTPDGLPVGLQILGPPRADAEVLSCASAFEQLSGLLGDLAPLAHLGGREEAEGAVGAEGAEGAGGEDA